MAARTAKDAALLTDRSEVIVRGGFFTWGEVSQAMGRLVSVVKGKKSSRCCLVVGEGAWVKTTLFDLAPWCGQSYILRGGTMEFDSLGALQVLWLRLIVEPLGGELVFGPKGDESGLILIDIAFSETRMPLSLSLSFRDVETLTISYDAETRITLLGLLPGNVGGDDRGAWAILRFDGDPYGLSSRSNEVDTFQDADQSLFLKKYISEGTERTISIHLPRNLK
ncbi:hypothetical protein [Novacetimonas pomaceti]|uniref:hypothetical protein n=1 Tax=Novacetimonas pomaceti TaxID=2021998 RepID=UPI0010579F9F|nr:hypothetical protein [Novacetimonas pomaceti]